MTKEKKGTKNPKIIDGVKVTKEFVFKLTDAESNEKGKSSAAIGAEILEMKAKLKDIVETHKGRIEARQTQRDELDAVLRAQEEKRTVEAVMVKNYDTREIAYFFEGKNIESRTMTESELQMEADLKVKKNRAKMQALPKPDPIAEAHAANGKDPDIAKVHQLETSRATKNSSVDGPTRQ